MHLTPETTLDNARFYALLSGPAILPHRFAEQVGDFAHDYGFPRVGTWVENHPRKTFFGSLGLLLAMIVTVCSFAVNNMATDTVKTSIAHAPVEPPVLAPGEYIYDIELGDSLSFIAEAHSVTVEALKVRNATALARWEMICKSRRTKNPKSCEGIIWLNESIVIPAGGTPPQEETELSEDIAQ